MRAGRAGNANKTAYRAAVGSFCGPGPGQAGNTKKAYGAVGCFCGPGAGRA